MNNSNDYRYGEIRIGRERSRSSRKGKSSSSSSNSTKVNKQPQRGLGVAQLEQIRLHSEMGTTNCSFLNQEDHISVQTSYQGVPSSSCFSYTSSSSHDHHSHQNIMLGFGKSERSANISFCDSQPSTTTRWDPSKCILESQPFVPYGMTMHFLTQQLEDALQRNEDKDGSDSNGSVTSDTQELDLELRLSI